MPYKECSKCAKMSGVRTITCSCGSREFLKRKKEAATNNGAGQGYKRCIKCDAVVPIVSQFCKKCGHKFFDKKDRNSLEIDEKSELVLFEKKRLFSSRKRVANKDGRTPVKWHELQRGDIIKVIKGGPFWTNKNNQRISMGYRGSFTVLMIKNDGILAYTQNGGFAFLYMGERRNSPCDTGTILRPYKLAIKRKCIE